MTNLRIKIHVCEGFHTFREGGFPQEMAGAKQTQKHGKSCQLHSRSHEDSDRSPSVRGDGSQLNIANHVHKSSSVNKVKSLLLHQKGSAQKVLKCFYTNSDSVLNKRNELLAVIANECIDIICITETLPKNHGGKLYLLNFSCQVMIVYIT